jgi:acetyl-CoA carboxylase biotin carboxyl carrier protein
MELTPEAIRALLDAFDRSDWREMTVTVGNDRLHVSRDPSPNGAAPPPPREPVQEAPPEPPSATAGPAPVDAPEASAANVEASASAEPAPATTGPLPQGDVIESPSVGLFWRAPSPGAPPFVEVGDRVSAGDTVAIVEVMKLMNHVVAPEEGVVAAILVDNGAAVEFGQALVVVDPDG